MADAAAAWALVLAAGDGTRRRSLTTAPSGRTIPKQFCSLRHGPSLLHETLYRARAVTSNAYICAVVAGQHRPWWEPVLWPLPTANVVVQPANRGTANGILLPLLHIVEREPGARILILPSDHHVNDESVLARSMRRALERLRREIDATVLLGLEPEECDPDLGYIIPCRGDARRVLEVDEFVEKPSAQRARVLIERGALWNAFIVASTARALLTLFSRRMGDVVRKMRAAVRYDLTSPTRAFAIEEFYDQLPVIDFSSDILRGQEAHLRVLRVPRCGWSDLGTPERVAKVLRRGPRYDSNPEASSGLGQLDLATQHERLQRAAAPSQATIG